MTVLVVVAGVAHGLLAVRSALRAHREEHHAARSLAIVFASLAIAALLAAASQLVEGGWVDGVLAITMLLALTAYPILLLRFAHTLAPVRAAAHISLGLLSLALVAMVGATVAGVQLAGFRTGLRVLLVVFGFAWAIVHGIAARHLWIAGGRLTSTLARRRAQTMVAGVIGLGVVLPVAFAPGVGGGAMIAITGGVVAAALLWLGFDPPAPVRWMWQRGDYEHLTTAELNLLRSGDIELIAGELLPAVASLLDGEGAWLTKDDHVVAVSGIPTAAAARATAELSGDKDEQVRRLDDGSWVAAASTGQGWLAVRTSSEPILFGASQAEAFHTLAVRVQVVLDRLDLELREREADRQLRSAMHAEEMTRLKDDVISTLSHELRTPLVTMSGASELLEMRWSEMNDEQRLAFIRRIRRNAGDLHRLIQDTLDLAALRTGSYVIRREDFLVSTALRSVLEDLGPDRSRIEIVSGDEQAVLADPGLLSRAVRHLITNALKFSPDDATVTVEVIANDEEVTVGVSDNGGGLDVSDIGRAFDPMFRTGDVLRRETRGLGIGLSLVAEAARAMGGQVSVTSNPGEGSRFLLTLRRSVPAVVPTRPATATATTPGRGAARTSLSEDG